MLPVRVFFVKKGISAYISHLDVQRAVTRALLRSGYKMAFTEGFNPHLKLVFAMPLSLFQESTYEIFDFAVSDDNVSYDAVLERLRAVFPDDIMPFAVAAPQKKLSSLRFADYTIKVNTDRAAADISLGDVMTVCKKGKNGVSDVDIRPMIKDFSVSDSDGGVVMTVRAACGSEAHLNVAYICKWLGFDEGDCAITRTSLLDGNGELLV